MAAADLSPTPASDPATPPAASQSEFRSAGRQTLRTCSDYAQAQRVVDALADDGFPVERLMIVGEGLNHVERVVGRLTWPKVLLQGFLSGGSTGLLIALIFSFFGLLTVQGLLALLGYGFLVGAIVGTVLRAIGYLATGGKRDFQSVAGVQASRYLVLVDDDHASDAKTRLDQKQL